MSTQKVVLYSDSRDKPIVQEIPLYVTELFTITTKTTDFDILSFDITSTDRIEVFANGLLLGITRDYTLSYSPTNRVSIVGGLKASKAKPSYLFVKKYNF